MLSELTKVLVVALLEMAALILFGAMLATWAAYYIGLLTP